MQKGLRGFERDSVFEIKGRVGSMDRGDELHLRQLVNANIYTNRTSNFSMDGNEMRNLFQVRIFLNCLYFVEF